MIYINRPIRWKVLKHLTDNVDGEKYEGLDTELLGKIHRRKIDISDAIYVVNINGYIGNSTRNEIEYTRSLGKEILSLEPLVASSSASLLAMGSSTTREK